jgi:hypothetical protein
MDEEIWKPVLDTEYEASNLGRIRRTILMKMNLHKKIGYLRVGHRRGTKYIEKRVHQLVAEAFIGPCPPEKCVNHKNGVKTDNRCENLEYVSRKENSTHAAINGLYKTGKKHYKSVLSLEQENQIKEDFFDLEYNIHELLKKYRVSRSTIYRVISLKQKRYTNVTIGR